MNGDDLRLRELLVRQLTEDLMKMYGPMIGGSDLTTALGYQTQNAFRVALYERKIPVPIFKVENKKGKFALAKDIAEWVADKRLNNIVNDK